MPVPGISLVGFMDQPAAVAYLQNTCVPANPDPVILAAEWNAAHGALGPPVANAGHPNIAPIPAAHNAYIQQLMAQPWLAPLFLPGSGWEVRLVETGPLLAFQHHIDTSRSATHCVGLVPPVPLADLLPICLPLNPPGLPFNFTVEPQSVVVRSRSLNLRVMERGVFAHPQGFIGINIAPGLPHVQVARYNGRYYLRNGFHRMQGLLALGVAEIPCLFKDMATPEEVGIATNGNTFGIALLESANPPTCAHFAAGRGHPVQLRITSRIIHVSWGEHAIAEE